jgi:glycosyltransferase involved in cell wall biosynthesis
LVLFTNNYVSAWGARPCVAVIHDLTPFIMPRASGVLHGFYQRLYFRLAARRATHVITDSENSRLDICRLLRVPEERVTAVPLAVLPSLGVTDVPELDELRTRFGFPGPYILYAGAIHPRKNVERLVDAFTAVKRDEGVPHCLVIAGERRWLSGGIDRLARSDVVLTGRVSDRELAGLYRHAALFVYPSLYEGFGLPVLEAMTMGTPVVTSRASALPEVAGDAAVLVDPESVDSIAEGIGRLLSDDALAGELREKGRTRAAEFTWTETARRYWEVVGVTLQKI